MLRPRLPALLVLAVVFTLGLAVAQFAFALPPGFCAKHPDNPNCRTTSTSSSTTTTTPPPSSGLVFGISTGAGPDTVTAFDAATRARYYDAVVAGSATAVRVDFYGDPVNDAVVADARAKGLSVLVTPTRIADYPGDCTTAATWYGPEGVRWFELGNEPNLHGVDPAYYAAQAKACASAIRAVVPDARIVLGGLSNFGVYPQTKPGEWNPVLYLEQVLAALNGDVGWISAVSYHPYGFCDDCTAEQEQSNPSGWPQIAQQNPSLVSTLRAYGSAAKVDVDEHGAPTDGAGWTGGMSETEQARLATLSVAQFKSASWAGQFYWYSELDRSSYASSREGHFGLLRTDWTRKPAFAAYAAAIS